MLEDRKCGILLPVFSLPSKYGIGDLGQEAYRFVDFLREAGQSIWQILPLNPTNLAYDNSPYSSSSAFAGNHLLIDPDNLVGWGYLDKDDVTGIPDFKDNEVEYEMVIKFKIDLLERAFARFRDIDNKEEFANFCEGQSYWLDDYALFVALKSANDKKAWYDWPQGQRDRDPEALQEAANEYSSRIEREKFYQYVFYKQWNSLKGYCNESGVQILGDLPIYVNADSADTWGHQEIFKLGADKKPEMVSGVPPDYFSETGQLWGMPTYHWDRMQENGFKWWLERLRHTLTLYDCVRIDHFRGLVAYWEVPSTESTAVNGKWIPVPHEEFFAAVLSSFNNAPIIAEDLGIITEDVREVMRTHGFPGMKILQFAFGEDDPDHPYLPHNYEPNFVVYTGSHDNNTTRGWFDAEVNENIIQRLERYIGNKVTAKNVHNSMIRLAYASVAKWAIIPLQDILGLDQGSRVNNPSTGEGNWKWRLSSEVLNEGIANQLRELASIYGRVFSDGQ
jgi:4-alpha-glucanotransferase